MILGESGLGKTMLQRQLEASQSSLQPFVLLAFPALEPTEQLRLLCSQISETSKTVSERSDELLQDISNGLRRWTASDHHPVVCFDDAQLLNPAVMTEVVLPLLNLRDMDEEINLTIVLAGQPILAAHLSRHPQLRERVAVTATLSGMTFDEVRDYVQRQLTACGGTASIFSEDAVRQLHRVSLGNPRRLNRLCDMALLVGCAEELSVIEADHIDAVGTELLTAA